MAAVSLMVTCAFLGRWWQRNPTRWRLAIPILLWELNASLFVAIVIIADVTGVRVVINGWGLTLIIHAAITFTLYLAVMGVRRVNHAGSNRANR